MPPTGEVDETYVSVYENVTSLTKPEVHNVSQCRQRRTALTSEVVWQLMDVSFIGVGKIFIYSVTFAASYNFWRDFAGKGVLGGVLPVKCSHICRFSAMTLSPLHLAVIWPVFTIYICCFITNIYERVSGHCGDMAIFKTFLCAIFYLKN